MDLIYTNENKEELGIIQDYELDLAFGANENDFELTIPLEQHCLHQGYFVFFEESEIGGVVDIILPDTEQNTVSYKGRTWQGILNSKVLEPRQGQNFYVINSDIEIDVEDDGNGNRVIQELIDYVGLNRLFKASEESTSVNIDYYQFERYIPLYTGILKMLLEFNAKLEFEKKGEYVILSVVPNEDYSNNEEWTNDVYTFKLSRNYRPTNHLICLGKGDLQDRKIIHLFTDENGGIQPYTKISNPYKDDNYILTKENQVMFGVDEVCDVYDNDGAGDTENYILLKTQPSDWKKNYTKYFKYEIEEDEDGEEIDSEYNIGSFSNIEEETVETYQVQTSKPTDWENNYFDYYMVDDTQVGKQYKTVEPIETPKYARLKIKPWNWETAYQNYYTKYDDGDGHIEFNQISGNQVKWYKRHTHIPSDWVRNWKNYFVKKKIYKYKYVEKKRKNKNSVWKTEIVWKDKKVKEIDTINHKLIFKKKKLSKIAFTGLGEVYENRPKWKKKKFATEHTYYKAPKFKKNHYWKQSKVVITIPTWKTNTYYNLVEKRKPIPFLKNTYYKQYIDSYADLVAGGIEKLQESYDCDDISIKLLSDNSYDINDIVGATERITGIEVYQPITKKIIKVEKGIVSIDYEIGTKE